jgi:archaemetzincin
MSVKKRILGVVPVGDVLGFAAKVIAAHITGYLHLDAEVLSARDQPVSAYDERRFQYNAGTLLKAYEAIPFGDYEKVVAVLNVDLFVPIMSYVFGEARQGGKIALVSLFRLQAGMDDATSSSSRIYERAAKVALHELGHLYNLVHCEDHRCLMHFAGEIEQLDETPPYFCRYCLQFFEDALKKSA